MPAPKPRRAALGVRAHSGWAAVILLAGTKAEPEIVERRHISLCDPKIAGSKQPFHEAEPMPFAKAKAYIGRCTASTARMADGAVKELRSAAKMYGLAMDSCGILTSSARALPDLKSILASHALIHAAEGEFYRDAIAEACERAEIAVTRIREREIADWTASHIGITDTELRERIGAMGKALGPPWTADEKLSAMIAWLVLASGNR